MGTTLIKQAMKEKEQLAAHRCKPRSDGADVILEYNIFTKSFCRDFPVYLNGLIDPDMYRKILAEVETALKQYSDSQSDLREHFTTGWLHPGKTVSGAHMQMQSAPLLIEAERKVGEALWNLNKSIGGNVTVSFQKVLVQHGNNRRRRQNSSSSEYRLELHFSPSMPTHNAAPIAIPTAMPVAVPVKST